MGPASPQRSRRRETQRSKINPALLKATSAKLDVERLTQIGQEYFSDLEIQAPPGCKGAPIILAKNLNSANVKEMLLQTWSCYSRLMADQGEHHQALSNAISAEYNSIKKVEQSLHSSFQRLKALTSRQDVRSQSVMVESTVRATRLLQFCANLAAARDDDLQNRQKQQQDLLNGERNECELLRKENERLSKQLHNQVDTLELEKAVESILHSEPTSSFNFPRLSDSSSGDVLSSDLQFNLDPPPSSCAVPVASSASDTLLVNLQMDLKESQQHVSQLEQQVQNLQRENGDLKKELAALRTEDMQHKSDNSPHFSTVQFLGVQLPLKVGTDKVWKRYASLYPFNGTPNMA